MGKQTNEPQDAEAGEEMMVLGDYNYTQQPSSLKNALATAAIVGGTMLGTLGLAGGGMYLYNQSQKPTPVTPGTGDPDPGTPKNGTSGGSNGSTTKNVGFLLAFPKEDQ